MLARPIDPHRVLTEVWRHVSGPARGLCAGADDAGWRRGWLSLMKNECVCTFQRHNYGLVKYCFHL